MKLGTCVYLGAAGLFSLGLASTASLEGCSSSSTPAAGGDSGVTGATGTDSGATGATGDAGPAKDSGTDAGSSFSNVPPGPTGSATTSTTPHNFALHHIHVGDEADSSGNPNWYLYGYDIDGKDTTASSKDVCTLYANANAKNQADGPGGIDNSFGENIIPLLASVLSNPSETINTSLEKGSFTVMMDITGLDGTAAQTATGLTGQLFGGTVFGQGPNAVGAAPTWTTADNWPLDKTSITSTWTTDGGVQTLAQPVVAKNKFTGAYIVNGEFVSGTPTAVTLTLTISGTPLVIPIQHATITFNTPGTDDAGTSAGHLSSGIISGVIDAATLVGNLQGVAGNISPSFCSGSTFATIAKAIQQASDIQDDGTNVAGTPCAGISIGVGFDGDEIGQPLVAGDPPPATNPCASDDGGTDSGTTDAGTPVDSGATDN
jgi:hypothetical protein